MLTGRISKRENIHATISGVDVEILDVERIEQKCYNFNSDKKINVLINRPGEVKRWTSGSGRSLKYWTKVAL